MCIVGCFISFLYIISSLHHCYIISLCYNIHLHIASNLYQQSITNNLQVLNVVIGDLECFMIKDDIPLSNGNVNGMSVHEEAKYVFAWGGCVMGLLLQAKGGDFQQGFARLFVEMYSMLPSFLSSLSSLPLLLPSDTLLAPPLFTLPPCSPFSLSSLLSLSFSFPRRCYNNNTNVLL